MPWQILPRRRQHIDELVSPQEIRLQIGLQERNGSSTKRPAPMLKIPLKERVNPFEASDAVKQTTDVMYDAGDIETVLSGLVQILIE